MAEMQNQHVINKKVVGATAADQCTAACEQMHVCILYSLCATEQTQNCWTERFQNEAIPDAWGAWKARSELHQICAATVLLE